MKSKIISIGKEDCNNIEIIIAQNGLSIGVDITHHSKHSSVTMASAGRKMASALFTSSTSTYCNAVTEELNRLANGGELNES